MCCLLGAAAKSSSLGSRIPTSLFVPVAFLSRANEMANGIKHTDESQEALRSAQSTGIP
jgi:hypothetical protein